jgi:ADP-ribosylglycohydrolase
LLFKKVGQPRWEPLSVRRTEANVVLVIDGTTYASPIVRMPNGEADHRSTLVKLAEMAQADGIELKGCVSCVRFRFSGMSFQFSGGREGYCTFVGFRNPRGLVGIDFVSGEHQTVRGWPDDPEAAQQARLALADREPRPSRVNAFEGTMLGLAIGDALGFPAEFRRREQIVAMFGTDGITDFDVLDNGTRSDHPPVADPKHPPGTYTDDTQMTIAVAEALLEARGQNLDAVMQAMADRFIRWSCSPENDRAPGASCMQGCANLAAGQPWREAGGADRAALLARPRPTARNSPRQQPPDPRPRCSHRGGGGSSAAGRPGPAEEIAPSHVRRSPCRVCTALLRLPGVSGEAAWPRRRRASYRALAPRDR